MDSVTAVILYFDKPIVDFVIIDDFTLSFCIYRHIYTPAGVGVTPIKRSNVGSQKPSKINALEETLQKRHDKETIFMMNSSKKMEEISQFPPQKNYSAQ